MSKTAAPLAMPLTPNQGRTLSQSEFVTGNGGEGQNLIGSQCKDCNFKLFPLSAVCPECLSENMSQLRISTSGKLYCYTKVHVAPPSWVAPYIIGYVDMPEGVRIFGKIEADREKDLRIDMPVTVNFAESEGQWRYFFSPTH